MTLPKALTTVTPFSKSIALLLFIILPMIGFYLGTQYTPSKIEYIPQEKKVRIKETEDKRDLLKRCGDIPSEILNIRRGNFTVVHGPDWAPDCRHIAWSLWESGTSNPVSDPAKKEIVISSGLYPHEGLYLYVDATKTIRKIYSPKNPNETVAFNGWKNKDEINFAASSEKFIYNLTDSKVKPQE